MEVYRQRPSTSSTENSADVLFKLILKTGKELLSENSELFKTAVAHLQGMVPREPSPVRRAAGAEQKGIQGDRSGRRSAIAFHKYSLPGDMGNKEYYQCMVCNERRTVNSFHADHQHDCKYTVRWYCPMCDTLYAVTHRGYHIKYRHGSHSKREKGRKSANLSPSPAELSEEDSPPDAKRAREGDETSQDSPDVPPAENVLAGFHHDTRPPPPVLPTPSGPAIQVMVSSQTGEPVVMPSDSAIQIPSTLSSSTLAPPPPRGSSPSMNGTEGRLQHSITSEALNPLGTDSFATLGDSSSFSLSSSNKGGGFLFPQNKGTITPP